VAAHNKNRPPPVDRVITTAVEGRNVIHCVGELMGRASVL